MHSLEIHIQLLLNIDDFVICFVMFSLDIVLRIELIKTLMMSEHSIYSFYNIHCTHLEEIIILPDETLKQQILITTLLRNVHHFLFKVFFDRLVHIRKLLFGFVKRDPQISNKLIYEFLRLLTIVNISTRHVR